MVPRTTVRGTVFLMVSRDELNALRAEARKRHRDATRKVSRLNRNGVQLSGTKYDPRRDLERLKSYNAAQARAYINQLDKFVARETQFVQYANGEIDKASAWQTYKKLENAYNRRVNKAYDNVEDLPLPSAYDDKGKLVRPENTVGRRMKTKVADRRTSRGAAVNAVYDPPKRRATAVKNRKALKTLTDDMRKRVSGDLDLKAFETGQLVFGKMNNVIRDKDLDAMIKALSPKQFAILWKYTSFADDTTLNYIQAQKLLKTDEDNAMDDDVFASHLRTAKDAAAWAAKLKVD